MGADLIGHFLFVPKNHEKITKEQMTKLKNIISPLNSVKYIRGKQNIMNDLRDVGVFVEDILSNLCVEEKDLPSQEQAVIEQVEAYISTLEEGNSLGDCRDTAQTSFAVNGMPVEVWFAGDMSWGDAPNGTGYEILEAFCYLGVMDALYKAIPWEVKKNTPRKKAR